MKSEYCGQFSDSESYESAYHYSSSFISIKKIHLAFDSAGVECRNNIRKLQHVLQKFISLSFKSKNQFSVHYLQIWTKRAHDVFLGFHCFVVFSNFVRSKTQTQKRRYSIGGIVRC